MVWFMVHGVRRNVLLEDGGLNLFLPLRVLEPGLDNNVVKIISNLYGGLKDQVQGSDLVLLICCKKVRLMIFSFKQGGLPSAFPHAVHLKFDSHVKRTIHRNFYFTFFI